MNSKEKGSLTFLSLRDVKHFSARNENSLDASLGLYQTETTKLYFKLHAQEINLGKDFFIGPGNVSVDSRLVDADAGVGFISKDDLENRYTLNASFGNNSDKFLADRRDSSLELSGSYALKQADRSQFILLLHYSNNRAFLNNIPLPGFIYIYRYSRAFTVLAGIPFFAFNWINPSQYMLTFFLTPAAYGLDGLKNINSSFQFIYGFNFKAKSFNHVNRTNENDKLIIQDKKITAGLKYNWNKDINVSMAAGFSFDRFIHEGKSLFQNNGHALHQDNDYLAQTKFSLAF